MTTHFDANIADEVRNALKLYAKEHSKIDIDVQNSVVRLTGIVESKAARNVAINAALGVPGVVSVQDQLMVKSDSVMETVGEYVDDALITTTAKAKLLAETGLASFSISVETNQGVVTLTGKVDKAEQSAQAERAVKMINGVKRVENVLVVRV